MGTTLSAPRRPAPLLIPAVLSLLLGVLPAGLASAQPQATPSAPSDATVSGTVYYAGTITGTHMVWVGLFAEPQGRPPDFAATRMGPGSYTITGVPPATYTVVGGMDGDDSGGDPDPAVDPMAAWTGNPLVVAPGAQITGVDIYLSDPIGPGDKGSISGQVTYSGGIAEPHQIIVVAQRAGDESPSFHAIIAAPGPYNMVQMDADTYLVAAFMDLGDDMGPPQPGEPFAWYDAGGDGQPDPVVVGPGQNVVGIDIALRDAQLSIYLPLVMTG